jgi:oligopeptidase B
METGVGAHGGPSGRYAHLGYEAEVLAWALERLNPEA